LLVFFLLTALAQKGSAFIDVFFALCPHFFICEAQFLHFIMCAR